MKDKTIKHYEVRVQCESKKLAKKMIEVLAFSGYSPYISYDSFHGDTAKWEVCYDAQPDEVTAVKEDI
jgi:hypothetical protein